MFQSQFTLDILKKCKKAGIHTALDTSGTGYDKDILDDILKYTDLILLDIKALNKTSYKKMTGKSIDDFEYFVKALNKANKKVWIRQVIIPSINDNEKYIKSFKKYISKINNIERIDLLPYHTMGVSKYKKLNLKYRLDGIKAMDKRRLNELNKML